MKHEDKIKLMQGLISLLSIRDNITLITRDGRKYNGRITGISNYFIYVNSIERFKCYRGNTEYGFDLENGELVYYV